MCAGQRPPAGASPAPIGRSGVVMRPPVRRARCRAPRPGRSPPTRCSRTARRRSRRSRASSAVPAPSWSRRIALGQSRRIATAAPGDRSFPRERRPASRRRRSRPPVATRPSPRAPSSETPRWSSRAPRRRTTREGSAAAVARPRDGRARDSQLACQRLDAAALGSIADEHAVQRGDRSAQLAIARSSDA